MEDFKNTSDIKVPEKLVDWVIGQDKAVDIIKKAAKQKRNVLLVGDPGTGKSMLAQSMAELMVGEDLEDVLVFPNPDDENRPKIIVIKTADKDIKKLQEKMKAQKKNEIGAGRLLISEYRRKSMDMMPRQASPLTFLSLILIFAFIFALFLYWKDPETNRLLIGAIIIGIFVMISAFMFGTMFLSSMGRRGFIIDEPKIIIDNSGRKTAPFVEATGGKAGALFGDVKHDPLQSGGLGTPAHLRVEAGAIHKANKGVLFIDEISALTPKSQQDLLSAMQDKKFSITGQSELSSGALIMTEPAPCDFVLVAAGNYEDIRKMHPALRSRIRGYGYEVYMDNTMEDSEENRGNIARFVAQEVIKDGKIPHFKKEAVEGIIEEARRKAGRKGKLSLRLRELGGLVRAAGDIAKEENASYVEDSHIQKAKEKSKYIEEQLAEKFIETKKDYQVFVTEGTSVGKVNGLAVLGESYSGLVLPIVAEVTPASSKSEGKLIVTGKLGDIAKEAVENVSAIIKKNIGKDVSMYDIHVQFLQTYEGVEGDSASISIAVAVISAMEGIGVEQGCAMTGSLTVRGEVLPVGGVTQKIEAAIEAGMEKVIIPDSNKGDVYLSKTKLNKIKIIPVKNIVDVLENCLEESPKKKEVVEKIKKVMKR